MRIIYEKLLTLLATVPELRWIDLDTGQLEDYQGRPAVAFPCALIDLELITCTDSGGGIQECECRATVRVAFDYTGDHNSKTPLVVRDKALKYFDTVEKVYTALQGKSDSSFSRISRNSLIQEKRDDGLKVTAIPFDTTFDDYTAQE